MSDSQASEEVSSPCTGVCRLDETEVYCIGCKRTLTEIRRWPLLDSAHRHQVLDRIRSLSDD